MLNSLLLKCGGVRELSLSSNKISCAKCLPLSEIGAALVSLDLSNNLLEEIPICACGNLRSLNLSSNRIAFDGVIYISKLLLSCPLLTCLNLSHNAIESEGFDLIIYAISQTKNVWDLNLGFNEINAESILSLIVKQDRLRLQHLDISGNHITQDAVFNMLMLLKSIRLSALTLTHLTPIERVNLHADKISVNYQLEAKYLTELDLSHNQYICRTLFQIFNQRSNVRLRKLNLTGCYPLFDEDVGNLGQYIHGNDYLRELILSGVYIFRYLTPVSQPDALLAGPQAPRSAVNQWLQAFLDALSSQNAIAHLDLSDNEISDNCRVLFPALQSCPSLRRLNLSHNNLVERHRLCLTSLIQHTPNLTELDLSRNQIKLNLFLEDLNQEADKIYENQFHTQLEGSRIIRSKLTALNISDCGLNGEDINVLGKYLHYNNSLSSLNFSGHHTLLLHKKAHLTNDKYPIMQLTLEQQVFYSSNYFGELKNLQQSLVKISLKKCIFNRACAQNFLAGLNELGNLVYLKLQSIILNDRTYEGQFFEQVMIAANKLQSLEILLFKNIRPNTLFFNSLKAGLEQFLPSLKTLNFSDNTISRPQLLALGAGLAATRTLKNLYLNNIREEKVLCTPDLSDTAFETEIDTLLDFLEQNCSIRFLSIKNNSVNLSQLSKLTQANKQLQYIVLSNLRYSQEQQSSERPDLVEFASTLRYLDLSCCGPSCQQLILDLLVHFVQRPVFFESLNLKRVRLQDKGARAVAELIQSNKSLVELNLSGNEI